MHPKILPIISISSAFVWDEEGKKRKQKIGPLFLEFPLICGRKKKCYYSCGAHRIFNTIHFFLLNFFLPLNNGNIPIFFLFLSSPFPFFLNHSNQTHLKSKLLPSFQFICLFGQLGSFLNQYIWIQTKLSKLTDKLKWREYLINNERAFLSNHNVIKVANFHQHKQVGRKLANIYLY